MELSLNATNVMKEIIKRDTLRKRQRGCAISTHKTKCTNVVKKPLIIQALIHEEYCASNVEQRV